MKKFLIAFLFAAAITSILLPFAIEAQQPPPQENPGSPSFSLFNEQDCSGAFTIGPFGWKYCTLCDLFKVVNRAVNFGAILVIPAAAVMIIWGGILIMVSAGNTSKVDSGRKVITAAAIGLAITLGAWLIINEIILVMTQGGLGKPWNQIQCGAESQSGGGLGVDGNGNSIGGFTGRGGQFGGGGASGRVDYWYDIPGQLPAAGTDPFNGTINNSTVTDGYDVSGAAERQLLDQNVSWDQSAKNEVCTLGSLQPYGTAINDAAQRYGVDPARLQAVIMAESSGNTNASHTDLDGKASYGLMQIRPDTARTLDPSLAGKSDAEIGNILKNNSNYNVELGAKYYSSLLKKYNNDPNLASAAYNGGPTANLPSRDCPGSLRWQCKWDNTAHTKPNTGYNPTRKYIPNIQNTESKIKNGQCGK